MMELGVLSDMFDIKKKALKKLFMQQVNIFSFQNSFCLLFILILTSPSFYVQSSYRVKLLSSYKDMVSLAQT